MNIFLPYADNIVKSVQSLDNRRLVKQILETKTLLDFALGNSAAYGKHPVAQFYKNNPDFLAYYGLQCCYEYNYRNKKTHSLEKYFHNYCIKNIYINDNQKFEQPNFIPYYMEQSKNAPECIRYSGDARIVSKLFQAKLIKKWLNDKKSPTWGTCEMPKFFEDYISLSIAGKEKYWEDVEILKFERRLIDKYLTPQMSANQTIEMTSNGYVLKERKEGEL